MFWKLAALSASSPVDAVLDKESFTLEELLDEEEIIQECKALNSRLINFLRDRAQVEQLVRYIVEDPPEDAESERVFKFPFIACEVLTCEIDIILKTLVEEEELMDLLFSFLEPNRPHSALLSGYFSKVVVCLMMRKTIPLMNYVQVHQDVFRQLVDLIGITSIMEVLVRLVGADDHVYPNYLDVMQWLADSNLLEMIVDKLNPFSPSEVHTNAAETLCAITRNCPSALATKLSSPSFVARIFGHALEASHSKSGLVHSLSVCISLLNPKRSATPPLFHSFRSQHMYEIPIPVHPDTVSAMLPKLGGLLMLLNVSADEKMLPTTYGELRPPLGKHRLKIVEFIAVLLKTDNEAAKRELVSSGTIQQVLDLFFEYPYNNSLHHQVESIISSCLESRSSAIVDHLLQECDLIGKILLADKHPVLAGDLSKPTLPAAGKQMPRAGNIGHITRICNKLVQLGNSNSHILACLQENSEWNEWQATVIEERNAVENVYRWACGRPTALHDRTRDSDDDDIHDQDYDVAALANNLSQAFRYNIYDNEEAEEDHGSHDQDDEEGYLDDESAEIVISSLRLGDDQGSLFTNSNWFAFDNGIGKSNVSSSQSELMDEILKENMNGRKSSSDDEVVVGEDEMSESKDTACGPSSSNTCISNGLKGVRLVNGIDMHQQSENKDLREWVRWGEPFDLQVEGSSDNPFDDNGAPITHFSGPPDTVEPSSTSSSTIESTLSNGSSSLVETTDGAVVADVRQRAASVPSLFEEDVEFVGVELEGSEKAMEQALKEGIVGEAGPLKRNNIHKVPQNEHSGEDGAGVKEFNDTNYWRVDQEVAVLE